VFDKLKQLFGGSKDGGSPRPSELGGPRPPGNRPIPRTRAGAGAAGMRTAQGAGRDAALGGRAAAPGAEAAAAEIPCPSCGEPMLAGWGTTCGKCRPNLVAPKTLFMSPAELAAKAAGGMTLGWLVVIRSVEQGQQGTLVDVDRPTVVLSRAGAPPTGADKLVQFQDDFMSSGHAILRRPPNADRTAAFTVSDRENPGPSVNGTFVNSHKLAKGEVVRLSDGDIIKVGATELLFKSLWLPPLSGPAPT
jgi:hypothetical protein